MDGIYHPQMVGLSLDFPHCSGFILYIYLYIYNYIYSIHWVFWCVVLVESGSWSCFLVVNTLLVVKVGFLFAQQMAKGLTRFPCCKLQSHSFRDADLQIHLARLCSDSTFRSRFLYVAPPRFPLEVADVFQRLVKDLQRGECRWDVLYCIWCLRV